MHLTLQEYIFPEHLDYVELVYDSGSSTATVRTTKALDVEALEVLFLLHIERKVFLTSEKEVRIRIMHLNCSFSHNTGWYFKKVVSLNRIQYLPLTKYLLNVFSFL